MQKALKLRSFRAVCIIKEIPIKESTIKETHTHKHTHTTDSVTIVREELYQVMKSDIIIRRHLIYLYFILSQSLAF